MYIENFLNLNNQIRTNNWGVYENADDNLAFKLINAQSLALTESKNYSIMMESSMDSQEIKILEAKIDVLNEISIREIGQKIIDALTWIKDQIVRFFRWLKSLFSKSKVDEAEKNVKKAKEELKNDPGTVNFILVDKGKNSTAIQNAIKSTELAIRDGKSVPEAVSQVVDKEELDSNSKEKRNQRQKYKLLIKQSVSYISLYFDATSVINTDFVSATDKLYSSMDEELRIYGGGSINGPSNTLEDKDEQFDFDPSEITSCIALKREVLNYDSKLPILEFNNGNVKLLSKNFNSVLDRKTADNMKNTAGVNLSDISTYIKWLETKISMVKGKDIPLFNSFLKQLDKQIDEGKKVVAGYQNYISKDKSISANEVSEVNAILSMVGNISLVNKIVCEGIAKKLQNQLSSLYKISKTIVAVTSAKSIEG